MSDVRPDTAASPAAGTQKSPPLLEGPYIETDRTLRAHQARGVSICPASRQSPANGTCRRHPQSPAMGAAAFVLAALYVHSHGSTRVLPEKLDFRRPSTPAGVAKPGAARLPTHSTLGALRAGCDFSVMIARRRSVSSRARLGITHLPPNDRLCLAHPHARQRRSCSRTRSSRRTDGRTGHARTRASWSATCSCGTCRRSPGATWRSSRSRAGRACSPRWRYAGGRGCGSSGDRSAWCSCADYVHRVRAEVSGEPIHVIQWQGEPTRLWGGTTSRGWIGDADDVLELFWLLLTAVLAWARPCHDLMLENLLLRHQLAVLTPRLEPDRELGCAPGTSCSGCWLAAGMPAGATT